MILDIPDMSSAGADTASKQSRGLLIIAPPVLWRSGSDGNWYFMQTACPSSPPPAGLSIVYTNYDNSVPQGRLSAVKCHEGEVLHIEGGKTKPPPFNFLTTH